MSQDFAGRIEPDIGESSPDSGPYLATKAAAGAPNVGSVLRTSWNVVALEPNGELDSCDQDVEPGCLVGKGAGSP